MFRIGDLLVDSPVVLAPMAGITDLPFRRLSRRYGAGLTTSEMITSDCQLWHSRKSSTRLMVDAQDHPVSMQIAGAEPQQLAEAGLACTERGAQIIDINMGCPAKKVCKKLAGSALLADEDLVAQIIEAVVSAVNVPVTLKIRTGIDPTKKNALNIAKLAEELGIQALAIHGRTRACKFGGEAEYDTIAQVVDAVSIPVIANGDIRHVSEAESVLKHTNASAVMIGRGALGQPWFLREVSHFLKTGKHSLPLTLFEKHAVVREHIGNLHTFYGRSHGVRIARKHFAWYCENLTKGTETKKAFNTLTSAEDQISYINNYFQWLIKNEDKAA